MIALILALGAALSWGLSDFLGGVTTANLPVTRVLATSQPLGLAVCSVALVSTGQQLPTGAHLVEAAIAGAAAVLALGLLYVALAKGTPVIVAPLAAIGAGVPVAVGVVRGDPITAVTVTATALALLGIIGASWTSEEGQPRLANLATVALALGAAICTGIYLTLIDDASSSGNPLGVVEALRVTASVIAIAVFLAVRGSTARRRSAAAEPGQPTGQDPPPPQAPGWNRPLLFLVAALGVGATDAAAETAFAAASEHGHLSVVAVVAGLYPVFTVLLALLILRHRVHRIQALAAIAALAGVALFAWA